LNVASSFLEDLSHLAGHLPRILFLAADENLADLVDVFRALRRRSESPFPVRLPGGRDGLVHVLLGAVLDVSDYLARIGGVSILEDFARSGGNPLPVDEVAVGLGFDHDFLRLPLREDVETISFVL
jgi:hypothetical protein